MPGTRRGAVIAAMAKAHTTAAPRRQARNAELAFEIAVEAYIYLYPLVLMDTTRRQMTNVKHPGDRVGRAPMNTLAHIREFPPAGFHDVARANFDTLYSFGWADVRQEPMIVSVPDAGDHYYWMPMYDMWSDIFACVGTRTTGNDAGEFGIVSRDWDLDLPRGIRRLEAPTPFVWVFARTQCAGALDFAHANGFQDGMRLSPLSRWGQEPAAAPGRIDPTVDGETQPQEQVKAMSPVQFFAYASWLMKLHPPHLHDHPILDRMERIGLILGEDFDLVRVPQVVRKSLEPAVAEARLRLWERSRQTGWEQNGWQINVETMGAWGTDYLKRSTVDRIGLSAMQPEDAIYPYTFVDGEGEPLAGTSRYVLHFERDELPPARAFWSLTLYDGDGFAVPNPLERYALRDRDGLVWNDDGSLDLVIQHDPPRPELAPNWLPAPEAPFNLALRVFWPRQFALERGWAPPPVQRVE